MYINVNNFVLGGGDLYFMIRIKGMIYFFCFDFFVKFGDVFWLFLDIKFGLC